MVDDMDNKSFKSDPEKGTELQNILVQASNSFKVEQKQSLQTIASNSSSKKRIHQVTTDGLKNLESHDLVDTAISPIGSTCKPEVCKAARRRYQASTDLSESPWQRHKTILLIVMIALLAVWTIVYTTLSQLKIL